MSRPSRMPLYSRKTVVMVYSFACRFLFQMGTSMVSYEWQSPYALAPYIQPNSWLIKKSSYWVYSFINGSWYYICKKFSFSHKCLPIILLLIASFEFSSRCIVLPSYCVFITIWCWCGFLLNFRLAYNLINETVFWGFR